jgi:DNA-binding MarR family transcriptional regulator
MDLDHDIFDRIHERWKRERPEADTTGFEAVGRILLLAKHLQNSVAARLGSLDLDLWAYDVLATLWQNGPPYHLSPTELCKSAMLSSGAMTNRLDRLEAAGLVARQPDPEDRRGLIIELTPKGKALVDQAIVARLEEANEAASTLTEVERKDLVRLLRKFLAAMERGPESGPPA